MALFSWSMQIIKRSAGRSVVAAAAYRAGEKLDDDRQNVTHDYSRRTGVDHTEILAPDLAPAWVFDRELLWNKVEAKEKRKDSQVAREVRIMIPRELSPEERIRVVRSYIRSSFVAKGMVADVAWHNKVASDGLEQPHAHVLLTMRPLTKDGFGAKSRHDWVVDPTGRAHPDGTPVLVESNQHSWNSPAYFDQCRENWEHVANAALEQAGLEARIDRRSLLERGIARMPEPALRMAWYMHDLYGVMKQRFGQYLAAQHFRPVEQAARTGFQKLEQSNGTIGKRIRTAEGFYGWFERQIGRLQAGAPAAPTHDPFACAEENAVTGWQDFIGKGPNVAATADAMEQPVEAEDDASAPQPNPSEYRAFLLQRGRSRPALFLDLRTFYARSGTLIGTMMSYPQLASIDYFDGHTIDLHFGFRRFRIEGHGLSELVMRLQAGTVLAIQQYSDKIWQSGPPRGPLVKRIVEIDPAGFTDAAAPVRLSAHQG